ncbi:MAG: N-acetyl-gamma-glutamyl-phosphate reductase [Lachnospiraceae bacterium]|nr:N-acetyl-gamma-glutamyl-phosphate reductase [Lachnospiraceae bacterium]
MIKAGIIGSTGYAGAEIARLLLSHKDTEIKWLVSKSFVGQSYEDIYRNFFEIIEKECSDISLEEMSKEVDVIFTATPQGYLQGVLNRDILDNCRFIDMSADYRIKDVKTYEKWYGIEHHSPELLPEAVYGLTEVNREKIRDARLLANPGCFTTCSILTAYPLMKEHMIEKDSLIINALSGVSGAGRGAKVANLYCEVNESAKAYGVTTHRHTPEIEEQLGYAYGEDVTLQFTPHLVPMHRGILATETARLICKDGKPAYTYDDIKAAYDKYYKSEKFIRVLKKDMCPETRFVEGSNYVDVNFRIDERTGNVILMGALDNLEKGAASQAVQNYNVMFGFDENEGIDMIPMVP